VSDPRVYYVIICTVGVLNFTGVINQLLSLGGGAASYCRDQ